MKTIIVTGATSGFGQGLVVSLLERGYQVIATGRNLKQRQEIFVKEREKYGSLLEEMNLDVTRKDEIIAVASAFQNRSLYGLINNAGFGLFGPAEEISEEKLRHQFEVNFFGLVDLTQKLLPSLRKSQGHLINFSSILGLTGLPFSSSYCASKFAVEGYSESLAMELKSHGVKVSVIEPGGYPTKFSQSMEWGENSASTNSPYLVQMSKFKAMRDKNQNRSRTQDPQEVIDGVCGIISSDSAKLGAIFGLDAWVTRWAQRILPRNTYVNSVSFLLNLFMKK